MRDARDAPARAVWFFRVNLTDERVVRPVHRGNCADGRFDLGVPAMDRYGLEHPGRIG